MIKSQDINDIFLKIETFLLLIGQIGRVNLNYGISFYALEVVVFFHILYFLASKPLDVSTIKSNKLAKIAIWWIFFALVTLLTQSFVFTLTENIRAINYLLRVANFLAFTFFVAPNIAQKVIKNIVNTISFFLPLIALAQYFLLPDLRFLASYGWDPHMYRAVGTILDPPIMGSILGMLFVYTIIKLGKYKNYYPKIKDFFGYPKSQVLTLFFSFASISTIWKKLTTSFYNQEACSILTKKSKIKISDVIALILLFFSIVFLYSRSTYLATFIGVNYLFLIKKKYLQFVIFSVLFVSFIYLAPKTIPAYKQLESAKIGRISTVTSRGTEIMSGLDAFVKHPVWGIGFNRVREYKNKQIGSVGQSEDSQNHAGSAFHSFWVTQLATTGVLGVGLLICFLVELIRKKPWFAPILFIPAFIGLFDNTFFHPFVLLVLIFLYNLDHLSSVTN